MPIPHDNDMNEEKSRIGISVMANASSRAFSRSALISLLRSAVPFLLLAMFCYGANGQQTGSNAGSSPGALIDFTKKPAWLSGKSLFGGTPKTDTNRYQAQVPDVQINDGRKYGSSGQLANDGYQNGGNQVQNLSQRLGAYDADNQLLNTEVASLQQKLQLANQYNQQLKEQLAGTTGQVQQIFSERQNAAQQIAALQSQLDQANQSLRLAQQQAQSAQQSAQMAGYNGGAQAQLASSGATIRANNSLLQKLSAIQIPGGAARMDGDVIRIEFPSDRMFVPGSYQIQPAQLPLLQNITGTIAESFPRQIIGIEAHWDNTPLNPPGTTDHQLTATQGLAVLDQLVRLGLPRTQLFTMAMASNRPRHQSGMVGGVSPNRRIELVIYPETYDGS